MELITLEKHRAAPLMKYGIAFHSNTRLFTLVRKDLWDNYGPGVEIMLLHKQEQLNIIAEAPRVNWAWESVSTMVLSLFLKSDDMRTFIILKYGDDIK